MVSTPKTLLALTLLAAGSAALAQAPKAAAPGTPALFCCGRICADSFPEQCRGKPYRVLDSKGNVIKEVGAPLTGEQKAAAAAAEKERQDEEIRRKDQKRQDQALLDTYANVKEIDLARERAESGLNTALLNAEAQIDALRKKRTKLEADAAANAGKPNGPAIDKELKANAQDIKSQEELRDKKKRELEAVRAKYDAERKRYQELHGGR